MLEAKDVWKEYRAGSVLLPVLRGVSLRIEDGESVAIVGPSGAGKTTLLHLLAGLDTPTKGIIRWDGADVSQLSDARRSSFRNTALGIVFQFYHLLPELTALENVMLPGQVGHRAADPGLPDRAAECLEQVGLKSRTRHKPRELSGGEQQRVAIARALVNEPQMLLCDEPTGNLDSKTGAEVIDLLIGLHKQRGVGLVLVTHQEKLAGLADQVVLLEDGRVVESQRSQKSA